MPPKYFDIQLLAQLQVEMINNRIDSETNKADSSDFQRASDQVDPAPRRESSLAQLSNA